MPDPIRPARADAAGARGGGPCGLSTPDAWGDGWAGALEPAAGALRRLAAFLDGEARAGHEVLPAPDMVLRSLRLPLDEVRVLVVGQDPYPTPGHPVGLAFSVPGEVRPLPRSLVNLLRELSDDIGRPAPATGDLSAWTGRGVLLLNRVLTVRAGAPGSHRGRGWEEVTDRAVQALAARNRALVAVLWGREAQAVRPMLGRTPVIASAHPSPLSARRGFFGSRPFSRVNDLLLAQGERPVDWSLD